MIRIFIKDLGEIDVEMDYEAAKNTAANFVDLARSGFYEGLIFHRVIKGFMIQGGWGDLKGKHLDFSIKGDFKSNGVENNLKHSRGVISMARTMFKDSASSQFFIMHKDSPHLDGEYAAFGRVVSGLDVVDLIASKKTNFQDCPIEPVIIERMVVEDEPDIKPVRIPAK